MCGIVAIIGKNGVSTDREAVLRMSETLQHRGPNSSGCWTSGAVGFGFRRLSILDLSSLQTTHSQQSLPRQFALCTRWCRCRSVDTDARIYTPPGIGCTAQDTGLTRLLSGIRHHWILHLGCR